MLAEIVCKFRAQKCALLVRLVFVEYAYTYMYDFEYLFNCYPSFCAILQFYRYKMPRLRDHEFV